MHSVNEQTMHFNKSVKINFEGGNLTSDAGWLLYKEFDEKIGLSQAITDHLNVNDPNGHVDHFNDEVIIQKMYQHVAGYHADDHADELRYEPVLTTVLGKEALASQPTISRLNQKLDKNTMKQLQSINAMLQERVDVIRPKENLMMDLDSTNFATYGEQHGSAFNTHYQAQGYHPLMMFDGLTGDCLKAELRSGNVYTSRQVVRFVGPEIKRYQKHSPWVTLCIRGDSGFAIPELYQLAETHDVHYVIRLKANNLLKKKAQKIEDGLWEQFDLNTTEAKVFYKSFDYQARIWDKPRRVVVKMEKPEGELFFTYTFIVTNMQLSPKNIVKLYANRGTMENFIKEAKNGFAFDQMGSPSFYSNATRLQIAVLAYNFNNWFRRLCLPKLLKKNRIENVRLRLIKIAGKIIKSGRYITFKLCSSCLHQKAFWQTLSKIQKLPKFT
jgi:hypothetical protein